MSSEFKKIMRIAAPSTIAWIGHIGYNIIDNIMVGKVLGSEALAISGIASAIYFIFLIFGMGASGIIVSLVSEANSTSTVKESEHVSKVTETFQNCFIFCFSLGCILFASVFFLGETMVGLVNKQPQLGPQIISYLRTLSFALLPVMIFFCFERLCEGLGKTKPAMYTTMICNVTNAFLNYAFLTGSFGFPNLGVVGAALSTTLNICLEVIVILMFLKFNKNFAIALSLKKCYISFKRILEITRLGLPVGFLFFFEACAFNVASFIASKASVIDVAAHQIILWLVNGFMTPVYGLSVALTSRVAANIAQGKAKIAYRISLLSTLCASIYMLIVMGIFYIFGKEIVGIMLKGDAMDNITLKITLSVIPILIIMETFDAVQIMLASILRGYKDTFLPSAFALVSYWGVCIPCAFFFGIIMKMGVYGIWLGLGMGLILQSTLLLSRFIVKFRTKSSVIIP